MNKVRTRYTRFKEETTYGEGFGVATETFSTDISSSSLDVPSNPILEFKGGLGRGTSVIEKGTYIPQGDISQAVDLESIGYFLKWALGNVSTAGSTHTFNRNDNIILPSFAVGVGKDVLDHEFKGCVINTLGLEVSNEFLNITLGILAREDSTSAIKDIKTTLIQSKPVPFHWVTVKFGALDESKKIKSLTLNLENNCNAEDGIGLGSIYTNRIEAGESAITFSCEAYFEDGTRISKLKNLESFAVEILIKDPNSTDQLKITMPRCIFTTVNQQPSGRDTIWQKVDCKALVPATGYDFTAELKNSVVSY